MADRDTSIPGYYLKVAPVLARQVKEGSGVLEGGASFTEGDYIVSNPSGLEFVMSGIEFEALYEYVGTHDEYIAQPDKPIKKVAKKKK